MPPSFCRLGLLQFITSAAFGCSIWLIMSLEYYSLPPAPSFGTPTVLYCRDFPLGLFVVSVGHVRTEWESVQTA